jgi:GNAT superfamily N-acetyltransferase
MIRQFQPEDAPACCRLLLECLEKDAAYSPGLREKIRHSETPGSMLLRAGLFYVAVYEKQNRIWGVAGLDMNEIRLLFVSPEHRRQGVGRFLLEHVKAMVPAALFSEIFVYSSIQSVEFYRACGFREKGPFCFDIGGETLPTVFMTSPTGC